MTNSDMCLGFKRLENQTADLLTFTEENLNGKPHFLCSVCKKVEIQLDFNICALLLPFLLVILNIGIQ